LEVHGLSVEEECQYNDPHVIAARIKRQYSYEFDANGNWVKRYGAAWAGEKDKLTSIGKDVAYRTISYDAAKDVHPEKDARLVDTLPPGPYIIRKSGGVLQQSATKRVGLGLAARSLSR
jgi:hypothetical protein